MTHAYSKLKVSNIIKLLIIFKSQIDNKSMTKLRKRYKWNKQEKIICIKILIVYFNYFLFKNNFKN